MHPAPAGNPLIPDSGTNYVALLLFIVFAVLLVAAIISFALDTRSQARRLSTLEQRIFATDVPASKST